MLARGKVRNARTRMSLIYWVEEHPVFAERVKKVRARMDERNDMLCTSSLAVGEVLTSFYKAGEREMINRMREFFRPPYVKVLPFTEAAADHYAQIRAELSVSPPDAIHLACAAEAKVDLFLTNDRSLANRIIPGIQFIASLESEIL